MKLQILYKHIFVQLLLFGTLGFVYAAWNDTVSSSDTLTAARWNDFVAQVESNTESILPSGTIAAFNASCPTGWSEISEARGRTIVGAGSGPGLTTRTLSSTGGTEIPVIGATSSAGTQSSPTGNILAATAGDSRYSSNSSDMDTSLFPGGDPLQGNMQPYIVFTWCEKD